MTPDAGQAVAEAAWMHRCIALARRAEGRTAPNPMVGALVIVGGEVVAEGWHAAPGRDHAEVDALRKLGGRAEGATMVVNLEPCCHHGRTPPCTDALLAAGIRRVIVGMVDPNPIVGGRGLEILRQAGLEVVVGVEEAACRALNAGYILALEQRRPFVVAKAGVTLDGRIADAAGASRWITGEAARAAAHGLRDRCDAVLVGSGTLLADDPALTTRLPGGRDALPVVLDSALRTPPGARIFEGSRRPLLFCAADAPDPALPADLVRLPRGPGGLDLHAALGALCQRGVHRLLVEGGGRVLRALWDLDLLDELHLFVAPLALAGGPGWLGGEPIPLAAARRLRLISAEPVGGDVHLVLGRS